jgi:tight adherence protein B
VSSEWILILTFVSTALSVGGVASALYAYFFGYRSLLGERIAHLNEGSSSPLSGSLFKQRDLLEEERSGAFSLRYIEDYFEQARLSIRWIAYLQLTAGIALGVGVISVVMTSRWWMGAISALGASIGAAAIVIVRYRRRRLALLSQLPKALDVISRAVRAGQTISAAFQIVADDFDSPIADEFRLCNDEQNLGLSYEMALRNLARRAGLMELQILVVALLVQNRSGGNLAELLDNLSLMVNKRLRLQDRVRALTGEGRMQATVLIALPTVAFILLLFIAHDYAMTLWAYPGLLASSIAAQLLGAIWIRRCIHFEY